YSRWRIVGACRTLAARRRAPVRRARARPTSRRSPNRRLLRARLTSGSGWGLETRAEIHCLDARHALLAATLATGQQCDIPDVRGDHRRSDRQAALQNSLELYEPRRDEMAKCLEPLHLAVPAAHWDHRDAAGAVCRRVFDGAPRPVNR